MQSDMKKASREKRDEYIYRLHAYLGFTVSQIQDVLKHGGHELTTQHIRRILGEQTKENHEE